MLVRAQTHHNSSESHVVSTHVLAWGDDGSGQCLGGARSSLDSIVSNPTEVRLPAAKRDFIQVGAGYEQSFLVTGKGSLWCGGSNRGKCLSEEAEIEQFLGLRRLDFTEAEDFEAAAIAAGREHFVAVQKGGSQMLTWGASNEFGQTGQGQTFMGLAACRPRYIPVQPGLHIRVVAVCCGEDHSLALTEYGDVFAWGSNASGQLGIPILSTGSPPDMLPAPQHVNSGALRGLPVRQIASGMQYSMALGISGQVATWGNNRRGCLGLGHADLDRVLVPTLVAEPSKGVRSIAAGGHHSAAVLRKGRVLLAGDNRSGQLGRSPGELTSTPKFEELLVSFYVRAIALGESHTLLLSSSGELFGLGANDRGQLGEPVAGLVEKPRQIMFTDKQLIIWAVAAGPGHTLVLASGPPQSLMRSSSDGESPTKHPRTLSLPCGFGAADDDDEDGTPLARTTAYHGEGASAPRQPPSSLGDQDVEMEGALERLNSFGCNSKLASAGKLVIPMCRAHDGSEEEVIMQMVRPGVVKGVMFACLTVDELAKLVSMLPADGSAEDTGSRQFRLGMIATLRCPAVLGASFLFPALHEARLDAGGLGRQILEARKRVETSPKLEEDLLVATVQGLQGLAPTELPAGVLADLRTRDQVRALVLYLLVPNWPRLLRAGDAVNVGAFTAASELLRIVSMLPIEGRAAFRDIVAGECADVDVLRDLLVQSAQAIANAAVLRTVDQKAVVGSLWQSILLLQLLWTAELRRLEMAAEAAQAVRDSEVSPQPDSPSRLGRSLSRLDSMNRTTSLLHGVPAASVALPRSCFEISALVQAEFPPQLEFQLFHENARLHVLNPVEICIGKGWEVDTNGQLPKGFQSFMANGNLVPTAFKQRVLHVENHIRQLQAQQHAGPFAGMLPFGLVMAAPMVLQVRRENVVPDTVDQLRGASPEDLKKPLKVKFAGEDGVDEGGVAKEYFRLLGDQLFSADKYGMFKCDSDSRYLWFDPMSFSETEDFALAGTVLGLAVYNNLPGLDVNFPLALFKKLKDLPVTTEDLRMVFPAHAASLQAVLDWKPPVGLTDAEANQLFEDTFCLDFSVSMDAFGERRTVGLLPASADGSLPPVTLDRRMEFAELFKEWYLSVGISNQYEAFKGGFSRVCGGSPIFDCLSSQELEAIVNGERDLDFSHLRKGAKVMDSEVSFRTGYIDEFWEVLFDFDAMQRQQFLNFVTGSNLAPVGGLERLELKIQRNGGEPTDRLPTSHTCFNMLMLPEYSDKEKLRRLLMSAIANAEGFGLE